MCSICRRILDGLNDSTSIKSTALKLMTKIINDSFLKTLRREATPYTPVWMMRQAGRYLPEYRASRKTAGSFLELCKNKNFATEVALQPLDRYPYLDAAILFSDILTVPDAMGLGLHFVEGEGPKFKYPLQDEEAIFKLDIPFLPFIAIRAIQVCNRYVKITKRYVLRICSLIKLHLLYLKNMGGG